MPALRDSMATTPWPAHAQKAQADKCAPTDTHTHTCKGVAQTRHNVGHTSAHAHLAGQTGSRWSLVAVPPDVHEEEDGVAQDCLLRGYTLVPLNTVVPGRLVPGGKPAVQQTTRYRGCSGESPAPLHHSWLQVRCTGFCVLPTASSSTCGIEFST